MSFLLDAIGSFGFILILAAFFLNLSKKIIRNTFAYNGLNFAGSLIMGFYAYEINSILFVVFQFIWASISLYFLLKKTHHHIKHRKKKKS